MVKWLALFVIAWGLFGVVLGAWVNMPGVSAGGLFIIFLVFVMLFIRKVWRWLVKSE